jgi:hypothetical protein
VAGQCRLCLKPGVELQKSHYIPAAVYKVLREGDKTNPNPWVITKDGSVQTSKQKTAYLLCSKCENLLSKNGENWVLKHYLRADGRFPLAEILSSRAPYMATRGNPTKVFAAAVIPEIDVSALAYFGASIFWRGSIYEWNTDGSIPVRLGRFQEQFRGYLIDGGLTAFPQDCSLWVIVREGNEVSRLTHTPVGERVENVHAYRFPMPGLAFTLIVSKNIPENYRKTCIVRGERHPLIVTSIIERSLEVEAVKMIGRAVSKRTNK